MAMEVKSVELDRQTTASNPNGTFGFSVLGGSGTKFPAVVCEIDAGGPADLCGKIRVGDRLVSLNGEELDSLTPNELVQRIRSAPSPSSFVLGEDEGVREQVLSLLKKQEKRAQARQQRAHQQQQVHRGVPPVLVKEEKDKRKKIIEIEPPVNRAGGEDVIVQIVDNRIVGQFDVTTATDDSGVKVVTDNKRRSPHRSPRPHRAKGSPKPDHSISEENGATSTTKLSSNSLSMETHHLSSLPQGPPTKSVSMDNFRHVVNATSGATVQDDSQELNNNSPGLSGLNSSPKSGSISPYHEKERSCGGTEEEGGAETVEEGEHPEGTRIIIPQLRNTVDVNRGRHRSSLSEAVLVNELSKPSTREEERNAVGTTGKAPESPKWIDPEEKERLMQRYNVGPTRSNSRKQRDESSQAVTLARKLYMLDGFKKSEVAARLSQPTEFGHAVAKEYLSFFDFAGLGLSDALRQFLAYFSLTGESQERERVMQHFSERYYECNPQAFPSDDAVHGLSIATLLLNTDLHTDHGGRKMSSVEFSDNLGHIGVELPRHILKEMYESIKKNPLQWAVDDPVSPSASGNVVEDEVEERVYHVTIPGTFVQAVLPGSAPVFKEGFVMKKNIMEAPHKKVSRGKRHWKAYYAYLKGFLLYFAPPQGQGELHLDDTSSAITVTHCLAMRAHDYHKKSSVVRVTTADWHVFLLQATDVTDMQQWIGAINSAAALYSSPPLAAPIGSQAGFHRPTFPLAPTRNSQEQQIESHEVKVKSLEKEAKEHQARKPTGKNAKHGFLEEWFDQYEFLQFEINRFRIYLASLCSDTVVDFNAPLPSGLIPSPSISTLHNPDQASGESDFLEEFHRHGHTSHIVGTPPVHRDGADFRELQRHSPVFSRKPQFEQL